MKKYLLRAAYLILFFLGICVIYAGLDHIVSDDTASQTRVTFHDFYEEDEIDYLFVGPSHAIHSINAVQLSDTLDATVFNVASTDQDFVDAYYLIEDAINTHRIHHLYFEVSISRFKAEQQGELKTYIISDYMKSPLIRARYLLDAVVPEHYANGFFRLRRNFDPQEPPEMEDFAQVYASKQDEAYINYAGTKEYMGGGQWATVKNWTYEGTVAMNLREMNLDNFTANDIKERQWEYFLKILRLCEKKDVDLTLFITPYSQLYLMKFAQYEKITQMVYDAAESHGVPVLDFNLVKDEYLKIEFSDFYNSDHVTGESSYKIADFLAKYIGAPNADYFYENIHEKYPNNDDVLGVGYRRVYEDANGKESIWKDQLESVATMRLDIGALSWLERPIDVRMWKAVRSAEDESVFLDGDEIQGEKLDDYFTRFRVSYYNPWTIYRIRLLDPDTGEVLYEALTRFDMN